MVLVVRLAVGGTIELTGTAAEELPPLLKVPSRPEGEKVTVAMARVVEGRGRALAAARRPSPGMGRRTLKGSQPRFSLGWLTRTESKVMLMST
jgi:hypothetical protein